MTLDSLSNVMTYHKGWYDNKLVEPRILGYIFALWGFISSGSSFENATENFSLHLAAVLDTLVGLAAAAYSAYDIINSAVMSEAELTDATLDRYREYSGHGWLSHWLGTIQGVWVLTFLGYCSLIAVAPIKI